MLSLKLRGHFQYDGLRGNFRLLEVIPHYTEKAWRYGLRRRSSKSAICGETFQQLLETYRRILDIIGDNGILSPC